MPRKINSVRDKAEKLGIAKSQVADLQAAGRITDDNLMTVAEAESRLRIANALDKERAAELKRLKIGEANRELIPVAQVRELLSGIRGAVKNQLVFYLLNQAPQKNDGLAAPQQRANNNRILEDLCKSMAQAEADFLKGMKA